MKEIKSKCGHAFAPNCDECYEWAKEYITKQDKEISELKEALGEIKSIASSCEDEEDFPSLNTLGSILW